MHLNVEKKLLFAAIAVSLSTLLILVIYASFGLWPDISAYNEKALHSVNDLMKLVQLRQEFDNKQTFELFLVGIGVSAVTFAATYFLTKDLTEGVRTISEGTRKLVDGDVNTRIEHLRSDEFGQLGNELNSLAASLNNQDQNHKQWMADTSHELRTPIAILRAQVEAFQDGVQEVTPKTLQVLHAEIMGLSKLVDDLHWLARFDVGNLKHSFIPIDVASTLQDVAEIFEERFAEKGLTIDKSAILNESCTVYADNNRMRQVFINLLENSLRYTDKGGKLKLSMEKSPSAVVMRFDDSPPGIPEELIPKIFDRFFRVEASRSRELGGSGLGLAICKTIIEAHSGSITASKSDLGGIRIEVVLPTARGLRGG
jgi:two-component system sensor histidine kinase BaeS